MRSWWQFQTAGQLVFGSGATAQLGWLLARRGLERVLIVTDRRLEESGVVDPVQRSLGDAQIQWQTFAGGEPEPSLELVDQGVAQAHACQPVAIIGLGGGSNMDLAKMIAAVAAHGGSPRDYFGFDRIPGPVLPLICLPTTAGTGSEVSHAAVLTDSQNQIKVSTLSQHLRPALAVVDPLLTLSCPPQVTADSGIDALTHAIEAYTAIEYDQLDLADGQSAAYEGSHPLGACLAEQAISLIGQHLLTAVRDGQNRVAREGMALAATLAGMAFASCGVALVHALEYPIGGVLHCSHGAGNGLLLPYVMRYNLTARPRQMARIAQLLGVDIQGLYVEQAAEQAVEAVSQLRLAAGIPQRLRELGARREQLPGFAAKAFAIKRLMQTNPRLPTEAELLALLQEAY